MSDSVRCDDGSGSGSVLSERLRAVLLQDKSEDTTEQLS